MTDNIHYIFGLMPDFGGKPWSYIHYLSVKSSLIINPNHKIHFWYEFEPVGEWWTKTKPYITLHKINSSDNIFGNPLLHYAHKTDILRIQVLKEYGGIYIDSDVICLKPFNEINHCGFWMAKQYDYGLCNATMGGDKDAKFLDIWLDSYKTFRSKGWDPYWDEHSVKIPKQLSKRFPEHITILDQNKCFVPFCYNIQDIFHENKSKYLSESYSVHLWETISWNFISQITPDNLNKNSELGSILQKNGII